MAEKKRIRIPAKRRLIQLYAALLYNAHAKGFIKGEIFTGMSKAMCVPGLNCYSCPGAVGACPLGALQNALASSGARMPHYIVGVLLLYGLILGRTVCGFLCPVGLMQELAHKLPSPKVKKGRVTRALSWLKYAILAVFVILWPLWYAVKGVPLPAFCKYICPAGTLEGAVMLLVHPGNRNLFDMLGALFANKVFWLAVIAVACVFIYRAFCRFLCPLGAIYGLFARVAVIRVEIDRPRCIDCGKCLRVCPMDIRSVGDRECIHCTACIDECPTGAISMKAGKIILKENEIVMKPSAETKKKRRTGAAIAWALALTLLLGVVVYANWPAPVEAEAPLPSAADELPTGSEAGMRAADFTVPLYGGGHFTLSEQRGKPVVINFWATWCGPCVTELPGFDEVARQYAPDAAVVAVHSSLVTEDVDAWLAARDFALPFALDADGSVIASFAGSMMLPQTVVIDADGVIVLNRVGSMTKEELEQVLLPLMGK